MRHTVDYILGKPADFKVCKECRTINWYENDECVNCFSQEFIDFSASRQRLLKAEMDYDFEMEV